MSHSKTTLSPCTLLLEPPQSIRLQVWMLCSEYLTIIVSFFLLSLIGLDETPSTSTSGAKAKPSKPVVKHPVPLVSSSLSRLKRRMWEQDPTCAAATLRVLKQRLYSTPSTRWSILPCPILSVNVDWYTVGLKKKKLRNIILAEKNWNIWKCLNAQNDWNNRMFSNISNIVKYEKAK